MANSEDDPKFLHEIDVEVQAELIQAGEDGAQDLMDAAAAGDSLVAEDEERYRSGLRDLLGAVEAAETADPAHKADLLLTMQPSQPGRARLPEIQKQSVISDGPRATH